jgi:MFS family permease
MRAETISRAGLAKGGRRGLIILILLTYGYFIENLLKAAPSALSPILIEEIGLTHGLMGLLISSSSLLYGLMQMPSGILSEALGPGEDDYRVHTSPYSRRLLHLPL